MTHQQIDKAWIEAHIPHQGNMCLLDHVITWDKETISCFANSHQLLSNPLRNGELLSSACGIEYAAQAMAVHGALLAPSNLNRPRAGFLVSIRGATVHCKRLDDIKQALTVNANLINSSDDNNIYAFSLYARDRVLLEGRATVMLNTNPLKGSFL